MGYEVVLVEGAVQLGGLLNRLHRIVPADMLARDYLERLLQPIRQNPLIQIRTGARVESVQGYVGNFEIRVQSEAGLESFKVGAVVVATGAQVLKPEGYYGHDGKRVINHLELEALQQEGQAIAGDTVFIQCVGSRVPERQYCSRTCCLTAVKNALMIKEADPQARVAILYRDMQMYGIENEELFRQSKQRGVRYINYDPARPPVVEADRVRVFHQLLGREVTLPADRVVLSTPLIAYPDADRISQLLRVPLDANKFFLEGHAKLKSPGSLLVDSAAGHGSSTPMARSGCSAPTRSRAGPPMASSSPQRAPMSSPRSIRRVASAGRSPARGRSETPPGPRTAIGSHTSAAARSASSPATAAAIACLHRSRRAVAPAWDPGAMHRLSYVDAAGRLRTVEADGGRVVFATAAGAAADRPRLVGRRRSPDGRLARPRADPRPRRRDRMERASSPGPGLPGRRSFPRRRRRSDPLVEVGGAERARPPRSRRPSPALRGTRPADRRRLLPDRPLAAGRLAQRRPVALPQPGAPTAHRRGLRDLRPVRPWNDGAAVIPLGLGLVLPHGAIPAGLRDLRARSSRIDGPM